MPYTFGDEDGWFPEGDDNAHIKSRMIRSKVQDIKIGLARLSKGKKEKS